MEKTNRYRAVRQSFQTQDDAIVGRDEEKAEFKRFTDAHIKDDQGGGMLVCGTTGVGKTSLVRSHILVPVKKVQ